MSKYRIKILLGLCVCLILAAGCGLKKSGREKLRDMDFTVLKEEEIPEKLMEKIQEKKEDDFKMSYMVEDDLYIVRGFGMQETGGYSIRVQELYLAENAVYFDADLIGPKSADVQEKAVSYPFIVVKTERIEENVVFE